MSVVLDDSEAMVFELAADVTGGRYFKARDVARERIDLRALVERYAKVPPTEVQGSEGGYKARCFLPSAVDGFVGTCAEQDESEGHPGQNLSITLAEDGSHWRWRCFSCGRGQTRDGSRPGDVVDLVTHAEGFHVNEGFSGSLKALRFVLRLGNLDHVLDGLAKPRDGRAPVDVSVLVDDPRPVERKRKVQVPLAVALKLNRQAHQHWLCALKAGADSTHARAYLETRGVSPDQIERYAIGYARDNFADFAKSVDPKRSLVAQELGLVKQSAKTGKLIDALRNRIVFPYCYPDRDGGRPLGVYGFAGRNLTGVDPYSGEDDPSFAHYGDRPPPKWHNSRNVDGVWRKRQDALGVWQSLDNLARCRKLVICEGAFDMLAFDRFGAAAWALVGKEFTIAHALLVRSVLAKLPKGGPRPVVCYACDGESVGRKAVIKFAASMLAAGFSAEQLGVIDSDDGEDPATTELETLERRWGEPEELLAYVAVQLDNGTFTRDDLRLLVTTAPQYAARFDMGDVQRAVTVADAAVVEALVADPDLARSVSGEHAREMLSECPAWADVEAFDFADETDYDALPKDVRRAWLRLRHEYLKVKLATIDAGKPTDRTAMRQWSEARREVSSEKRKIAKLATESNATY